MYRRPAIDLCIEFCEKHGIEPREHGLAYEHMFPDWLEDASVFEIKSNFVRRCEEIASRYKDAISTIEITNELDWPEGKTALYEEPDYAPWCYKTASQYFPANQLAINEGTVLSWEESPRTTGKYYQHIASILESGGRIDAIGMQYHMMIRAENEYAQTRAFYDPEKLYAHMDLYSTFGKPLQVTEITIPASVTTIDSYAFDNCVNFTTFVCKGMTPPTCIGELFYNVNKELTFLGFFKDFVCLLLACYFYSL